MSAVCYKTGKYLCFFHFLWLTVKQNQNHSQQLTCLLLLCFRVSPRVHNSFIKYVSVSCHLPLNLGSVQLGNLNKWCEAASVEHHGGLKSHVFTPIFHFSTPISQPLPLWEKQWVKKLKVKAVRCKNPQNTSWFILFALPQLFSLTPPPPFLLSCSLTRPLSMSFSFSLHNYLL